MAPVYPFDDLDDMFDQMRNNMDEADRDVKPWQEKVKAGDYFARWSELGFHVYGEILQEDEPREKGLEHYRLCRGYSMACPQGEIGDIHVSAIDELISKEQFESAKERGWR